MNWRFWKREPEKRQTTLPFGDAVVQAILQQAQGSAVGDPAGLAALEACAGAYSRAFAAAKITPDNPTTRALSPSVMGSIGREIIRKGEGVYLLSTESGQLEIIPTHSFDVRGTGTRSSWFYRLHISAPSGSTITHFVQGATVLHPMFSYDVAQPWRGVPPLSWANVSAALAANTERTLSRETGGPSGYVVPLPSTITDEDVDEDETGPLTQLKADLAATKGKTAFVETTRGGHGDRDAQPQNDWQSVRFGGNPPEVLAALRTEAGKQVMAACGLSIALFDDSDGTAKREALRQAVMGAYEPAGRVVAEELSRKLEQPIALDFRSLWGHDLAGRASSFKAMVTAGMDVAKAAALSGLTGLDE